MSLFTGNHVEKNMKCCDSIRCCTIATMDYGTDPISSFDQLLLPYQCHGKDMKECTFSFMAGVSTSTSHKHALFTQHQDSSIKYCPLVALSSLLCMKIIILSDLYLLRLRG